MNPNNDSKNILNADVELRGTLKFAGELTFDGKLEGDISSDGTLNLGDNAVVKGNITVNSVVMRGKVNGNVTAREKIDIKSKTELFGDIRAPRLVMAKARSLWRAIAPSPPRRRKASSGRFAWSRPPAKRFGR